MAAVFYGQAVPTQQDLEGIQKILGMDRLSSAAFSDNGINRGALGPMPPTDPVIYRLYEVRLADARLGDLPNRA